MRKQAFRMALLGVSTLTTLQAMAAASSNSVVSPSADSAAGGVSQSSGESTLAPASVTTVPTSTAVTPEMSGGPAFSNGGTPAAGQVPVTPTQPAAIPSPTSQLQSLQSQTSQIQSTQPKPQPKAGPESVQPGQSATIVHTPSAAEPETSQEGQTSSVVSPALSTARETTVQPPRQPTADSDTVHVEPGLVEGPVEVVSTNDAANHLETPSMSSVGGEIVSSASSSSVASAPAVAQKHPPLKYRLQPGDTLESISSALAVPVETITEANGINPTTLLIAGEALIIPSATSRAFETGRPQQVHEADASLQYRLQPGDTLESISSALAVSVEAITEANGISPTTLLIVGEALVIPTATPSPFEDGTLAQAHASLQYRRLQPGNDIVPSAVPTANVGPVSVSASGVQIPGSTTAASRDYYNRAARPIVSLQLGERFIFPLTMPAPITSLFGWRQHPIFADRRFHSGTDLGAPLGTPIVATQGGRVAIADYLGGYGLTVILRHEDNNLETRYAHMARILVDPGDWVDQGEVIGLVGSTGNSTGPHLHFELRQFTGNGWVALNPDLLIQQTLDNLIASLNSPMLALATDTASEATDPDSVEVEVQLPFRPAQPNAN